MIMKINPKFYLFRKVFTGDPSALLPLDKRNFVALIMDRPWTVWTNERRVKGYLGYVGGFHSYADGFVRSKKEGLLKIKELQIYTEEAKPAEYNCLNGIIFKFYQPLQDK